MTEEIVIKETKLVIIKLKISQQMEETLITL